MAQAFSFGRELKGLDDDMKNVLIKHIDHRDRHRFVVAMGSDGYEKAMKQLKEEFTLKVKPLQRFLKLPYQVKSDYDFDDDELTGIFPGVGLPRMMLLQQYRDHIRRFQPVLNDPPHDYGLNEEATLDARDFSGHPLASLISLNIIFIS